MDSTHPQMWRQEEFDRIQSYLIEIEKKMVEEVVEAEELRFFASCWLSEEIVLYQESILKQD